jgi:hypothetical protein
VDIDTALTERYPSANRWVYGIGVHPTNLRHEVVYWVEVHPASADRDVKVILAKAEWLQAWLEEDAKELKSMAKTFIWISSGRTSFTLTSPQRKEFSLRGLQQKGEHFRIPDTFVL